MKPIRLIPLSLGLLITLTLGLQNCKKSEPDPVKPGVTTTPGSSTTATTPGSSTTVTVTKPPTLTANPAVTNISSTSALVSAVIIDDGGTPILEHGFVYYYGLNQDFKEIKLGTASGPFPLTITAKLTNLQPNTTYKVSAMARNKDGAKQVNGEFTTLPVATTTTAAGSWKEFGPYSNAFYAGYDFAYGNDLYEIYTELSTYSLTTQKQTLNAGPKFPGTGSVGLFKLVSQKAYALMNGKEASKPNNEIWEYDLTAKKWTRKADFPGTPRDGGIAISINGKLYFGTGNEYTKARPGYATTLKDWWEYDPATDKWAQKADMPETAYDLGGFNANGKAVVGMGLTFGGTNNREGWWEYNPQTNTWRTLAKITGDYETFGEEIWDQPFAGKNYALLLNKARTSYFMWIYDAATGVWSRSAELPLTKPLPTSPVLSAYTINGKPVIAYRDKSQAFEFVP